MLFLVLWEFVCLHAYLCFISVPAHVLSSACVWTNVCRILKQMWHKLERTHIKKGIAQILPIRAMWLSYDGLCWAWRFYVGRRLISSMICGTKDGFQIDDVISFESLAPQRWCFVLRDCLGRVARWMWHLAALRLLLANRDLRGCAARWGWRMKIVACATILWWEAYPPVTLCAHTFTTISLRTHQKSQTSSV